MRFVSYQEPVGELIAVRAGRGKKIMVGLRRVAPGVVEGFWADGDHHEPLAQKPSR
jgi:hypothetical protein